MMKISVLLLLAMVALPIDANRSRRKKWKITFYNIAYNQPFSPILLSIHNRRAEPYFMSGEMASNGTALMAETGGTDLLQQEIEADAANVKEVLTANGPLFRGVGNVVEFEVDFDKRFRFFSFGTMAINTNDCFVGATRVRLTSGLRLTVPGYDAGSEENNELCSSMPGPACADIDTTNERSGNGEGA